MILEGRLWLGDNDLRATDFLPMRHDKLAMKAQWDECAKHVLEDLDPDIASSVQEGDLLFGLGRLGDGHAHYYTGAIMGCRAAGFAGIFGWKVNGLFFRAAVDLGMPCWEIDQISRIGSQGDRVRLDLVQGEALNLTTARAQEFRPVPDFMLRIFASGGSTNWALKRAGVELD